jgi:CRP/FNR family transcriptional regulator
MNKLSDTSSLHLANASAQLKLRTGEFVYREGGCANGAYILKSGTVKLIASSPFGKAIILRIAKPGDVIGLSASLTGCRNDTSAVAQEPVALGHVATQNLHKLMISFNDISLWFAEQLSIEYLGLCRELSVLGLRRSAMSRLAKLLLDLCGADVCAARDVQVGCGLTHDEMAQMIGISRETVTRLLRELRERAVATVKGNTLYVNDLEDLRALTH